jgi:aminoglycoside phosphotransferase (APT) family kinase protein
MSSIVDVRDTPSDAFITEIRDRLPVESEIDDQLTRRMRRRSGQAFTMLTLAELSNCLRHMLDDILDSPADIRDAAWLSGGASKIQMQVTATWQPAGAAEPVTRKLVVRMEPAESLNASSRRREFELLGAMSGTVPVPEVYWVDAEGTWFPEPALVYAFSAGVTKPTGGVGGKVTGMGTNFGPRLRELLAPQFVDILAKIHTFDYSSANLSSFQVPTVGSKESAQLQINRGRRVWEEDRGEELPLMDVAVNWLERNVPVLDRPSIVHGDFRAGNFLFDETDGRILSVLDWERAYIGDRHRDLAWLTAKVIGHLSEDGSTYLVCGLMPEAEFYDRYQEASGLSVDPERIAYYEVLNRYHQVQTLLATSYRVARLAKSHQNILVARMEAASYLLAEELRQALRKVL